MSSPLYRLRFACLRVLLVIAIAHAAGSSVGSSLPSPGMFASAPVMQSSDELPIGTSTGAELAGADDRAEVEDAEARRRWIEVEAAAVSRRGTQVFWDESVRVRREDRRSCRPPNWRA